MFIIWLKFNPAKDFLVEKMTFGRKDKQVDKTTINYNAQITLSSIPLEAYDYIVNGKPAIEWIMERYQITIDKDSGIRNDPNDWAKEHNQPRYIIDLHKRVVTVSLETMKIVNPGGQIWKTVVQRRMRPLTGVARRGGTTSARCESEDRGGLGNPCH